MAKIFKWTVPVDDQPHEIGGGPVVHVGSQHGRSDEVQVWTQEVSESEMYRRKVQVVGTGQSFPGNCKAIGSVVAMGGHLVWHVVSW